MTDPYIAALERQARCFVHPMLIGQEADRAVNAIVTWELAQPTVTPERRERAWARITQLAA